MNRLTGRRKTFRILTRSSGIVLAAFVLLGMSDCPGSGGTPGVDRDTLTQRQKDSIVAEMPIPGARGVGRALEASDRMNERNARLDSIR